ncbi:helix-turn-helix domain-containing protein [Streptomyces rimosus]|uniref:helix-turn-helix domain-containing protein n=1 Tax=Streptomyces rimosus TaxID=1927 RepID=UPI0004C95BE8|nr:helix-turn-helix domain-containing protein [Streptomyces rimosus]
MGDEQHETFSIASRLDHLFRCVRPPGQGEYSYSAAAEAIRAQQGVSISHTYIWQLRTGRRDNPTIQHLTALAKFFGVPVSYFLNAEAAQQIDTELELLAALREADVTEIALRAADLSPDSRESMTAMIRKIWELEHQKKATDE